MKNWMVPVVLAVLGAALLLFAMPLDDGSYTCRSAGATLVDPGSVPSAPPGFFDEAKACNSDARRRGIEVLGVGLAGTVAAVGLAVSDRHRRAAG